MRRLNKEELRGPLARAVHAVEEKVRAGSALAAPGTHRRILGHRTYEEEKEAIWMSQRYLSALLKGNIITEDDARPSRYWRHHVVSSYSVEGNAPLWWWHDHPDAFGRRVEQSAASYLSYGLPGIKDNPIEEQRRMVATLGLKSGVEGVYDPVTNAYSSWAPIQYASGPQKDFSKFVQALSHHEISSELARTWAALDTKQERNFFPTMDQSGATDVGSSILTLLASGRTTPGTGISRDAFIRYFLKNDLTILRMQADGKELSHDLYGPGASRRHPVYHAVDSWNNYDAPFQMKIEQERYVDFHSPENRGRLFDGTRWLRMIWADAQVLTDEAAVATSGSEIVRYRSIRRYDVRPPLTAEEMRLAIGTTIMVGASGFMVYNGALTLNAQNQASDDGRIMGGMYTRGHLMANQTVTTPLFPWNASEPWAPRALPAAPAPPASPFVVPDFSTTTSALNSYLGRTTVTLSGQSVQQSGGDYFFPTAPNGGVATIGGVDILAYHPLAFYWESSDANPNIPDGQKGHKVVSGSQASFPASLNALVLKKEPLTATMDPFGILANGKLYTGQQSLRRELLFWGQALRGHVPAASPTEQPSTESWQQRLASLRLASWYGKGYIDMQAWDEARYGQDDPMDDILDAARVRTRHPYRWVEFTGYDDNGSSFFDSQRTRLTKDYEPWDSSFYDITILRRATPQDVPLGEEFYLCVANRRVTPIIATHGEGTDPHTWRFIAPSEMAAVSGSPTTSMLRQKPYAQIGSREITLPFRYVDDNGNAALFRLTEMTTGLTSDDGQASVSSAATNGRNLSVRAGLDTIVSSTGELAVALLPGEVKIFRVLVSPAVTTPGKFGRLGLNTQSKIIAETKVINGVSSVRYHCVYHSNFNTATSANFAYGEYHVFYTYTDWLLPDQKAPEAPIVQGGTNGLWKQEQRLDMAVIIDNDAADGTATKVIDLYNNELQALQRQKLEIDLANAVNPMSSCIRQRWSSAFPSVTLKESAGTKHLHVVYTTLIPCDQDDDCPPLPGYNAENAYGSTLNVSETRIPLPATGPITVQDPSARLQVIIDYKGNGNATTITDADFAAWGSPVVNAGQKNTYIAWASKEGIGVLAKPYRDNAPVYDAFPRTNAQMWRTMMPLLGAPANPYAGPRCPTLNPITHPQSLYDDATLLWQEQGQIFYTRLYNAPNNANNPNDDILSYYVDPVQKLCYETINGTTCAQDPAQITVYAGANTAYHGKVLSLSSSTEGHATMPSVTRDLDVSSVPNGQLRIVEANGSASVPYWIGTESITYQVRNSNAGGRSEVIRKHLLELRTGAQRTSARTLHYWWRSRSFSTSHSLFHPQVVPGLRYQDNVDVATNPPFQIPYRLLWNTAGTSSTVAASLNFRAINSSDTAVWNAYSLLPAATYASLWNNAYVGENPATFFGATANDNALVDVIPDRVLVVQNPYRKQTQPYVHSPSVHLTGGWPHLVTVSSNDHRWLHQLGRVAVEQPITPVPNNNTWHFRLSAEPFYKEADELETVRVHHGFESADGAASLHVTVRGEELPLQWTQFLDEQDPSAMAGHFSLVSEPFTVMAACR